MSSLGLSVVLLAAAAIAVVVGYNLWLMRRTVRPRAADPGTRDATRPQERGEPSLGPDPLQPDDAALAEPAVPPAAAHRTAAAVLDAYTDCIVEFTLPAALAAERLAALGQRLRRVGSKPVTLEAGTEAGQAAVREALADGIVDGTAEDQGAAADLAGEIAWRLPVPGQHYRKVRIGALLANRSGPMNAMEFSEFVAGVQAIAEHLNVLADTPDMNAVLARARALDDLCASLDAQMGLGVEAHGPLGLEDLAGLAAQAGCVERGNNRYARLAEGGEVLFSLALADAPNRLSLLLDVPRAPASAEPWAEMLGCARLCAERLGGRIVDDAGRPLSEAHLVAIEQQVAQRHQALEDAGFAAGSGLALRLFN